MAEYIDRKKVEKKVLGLTIVDPAVAAYADAVLFILRHEPEADVAPVVCGRWLDEDFQENEATVHGFAVCSVCGELSHKAEHGYNILSTYCPNCGAKMNGGD